MFFKPDQTNVSDARDAVKKQLLRSLIQQVVDELNDASHEGIGSDVQDILAEDGMQDAIESLKASMVDDLRSEIVSSVVSESISEMTPDNEAVRSLVKNQISQSDLSSVQSSVRDLNESMIEELCNEIVASVVTESLEDITPDTVSVKEMVKDQLASADFSDVRKAAQELSASMISELTEGLTQKAVADSIDEAAQDIEAAESLVKSRMDEADLSDIFKLVRNEIESRINSHVLPAAVAEETAKLENSDVSRFEGQVKDAVACMNADDMIGRLRSMVAESLDQRIQEELDEQVAATRQTLTRIQKEFVSERMERFLLSADWRAALEEAEAGIASRVVSAIEEAMANDEVFTATITDSIEQHVSDNQALREHLEAEAKKRVVARTTEQVVSEMDQDEQLAEDLAVSIVSEKEAMSDLVDGIVDRINEHLATEATSRLDQAERAADAAFLHVDTDHRHLTEATDSLEKELIKNIATSAVTRLADTETVQVKAMAWIPEDHSVVSAAVEQILQHVTAEVRKRATKEAGDTDTVVGNVLPSFTAETEEIRAAVRETRNRLVERVVNLTLHDMEDAKQVSAEANKRIANEHERIIESVSATLGLLTDRVAEQAIERLAASDEVAPEASSRVPVDNDVFQRAIKATMSLLIDDIVIEVGSRMRSTEKVSSDARKRMSDTPAEVRQAAGVLENMLLQQVAETAKERLYDVQHASEKASTFLRATKELDAIEEAMRMKLFKGLAEQVVTSIADAEKTSAEAFWHIDQQHDHIADAVDELRNQLLFTVAKDAMESISDGEKAAEESRTLIPATSRQMADAAAKLHETLIAEVAREAMNLMRDTEVVVEKAGHKLQDHQDVLDGMRKIVERHLMENLLASALTDIGSSVADMDESGERAFFRSAIRDIQANRSDAPSTPSIDMPTEAGQDDVEEKPMASNDAAEETVASPPVEVNEPQESEPADEANDESQPEASDAWSSLSDLTEVTPDETVAATKRTWRVNEFRPVDRAAVSGAVSGDGSRSRMPQFPKPTAKRTSLYLFGVVRTDDVSPEDFEGIEGISDDSSVRLLSCGPLTALVSATSDAKFHPDAIKASMTDSDWLKAHVRRHADVLAEAQSIQTVIPLRFGCVMANPTEVKEFVDAREESLQDALTRLHNRSEFSVRVRFEDAEAADDLDGVPSGVASFLRKAASDVKHAPNPDGIADRIHGHLARFSGEAMRNPVAGTEMILSATYLITMASEEDFRAEVRKLAAEFNALGIHIEVSGPWPPYHFVDIDFGGSSEEFAGMDT